ncbi:MAG: WD40/YVTN/BNR-like repeat-containing protein [Lewinella sp.]
MSDNRNNFFRSTDKGMTWTELAAGLPVAGTIKGLWRGADGNFHILNVLGARASSTDDGANWEVNSVAGFSLNSVVIKEGKILAAGRRLGLWTSEDDWSSFNYTLGEEQYFIAGISFGERNHGFAIASKGHFFRTTDGGENWDRAPREAGFSTGKFVHAYDRDKVIVQTSGAGLTYTTNGGNTFTNLGQELNLGINSTTALNLFPNGDIAILTGTQFHVVSPELTLRSTTDITAPVIMPSSSKLTMISTTTGFLTGGGGRLWRTADSGASWTLILDGGITNQPYREMYFVNDQLGFCGDQNISIRTTDGGLTWDVYRDLPGGFNFVKTPNGAILKMASANRIFESVDNGTSWQEVATLRLGLLPCPAA